MTRILQISDLHIMPAGRLFQGTTDTAAALRRMLAGLAGLLPVIGPVERLVISGDLTETGCADAYDHLRKVMADAPLPWCAIPGNHDSRAAMRAFAAHSDWMPVSGLCAGLGGVALEQFPLAADRDQFALHPATDGRPVAVRRTRERRRYLGHLGGHGHGDRPALDRLFDLPASIRASLPDRWREMRTP